MADLGGGGVIYTTFFFFFSFFETYRVAKRGIDHLYDVSNVPPNDLSFMCDSQ